MTRFIKNLILLLIALIVVPLSVANRHGVNLSLNPFDPQDPGLTIHNIPLFWLIFAALALGIIIGGVGAWTKQGRWRKEARQNRSEAKKWHKEADQLRGAVERQAQAASLTGPNRDAA